MWQVGKEALMQSNVTSGVLNNTALKPEQKLSSSLIACIRWLLNVRIE